MCRLFGFRSVLRSQVHRSLMSADNALGVQSEYHPDGWGVAYYVGSAPHLIRGDGQAQRDRLFQRVSGIVSSETVVAHVRRATQGVCSPLNSHPFQHGQWIFAHNGNIAGFAELRPRIEAMVHPSLRPWVLGDTDSELFFYLLLTRLAERIDLHASDFAPLAAADALLHTIDDICALTGGYSTNTNGSPDDTYLTCILTNGSVMLAHQGGKELYYSTHKAQCPERATCAAFGGSCERSSGFGERVNHLLISSEPLQGENVWQTMAPGQIVAVDRGMTLQQFGAWSLNAAMI